MRPAVFLIPIVIAMLVEGCATSEQDARLPKMSYIEAKDWCQKKLKDKDTGAPASWSKVKTCIAERIL